MDPATTPAVDDDMVSWSSSGGPSTPMSSTLSPSPPPPPPSLHTYDCPIAVGARDKCQHSSGACEACQYREHGEATATDMLEWVCVCAEHNPAPRLSTPVGRQRFDALVRAGATDLLTLESAREHVTWLSAHMSEAITRVIQARMIGARPNGNDIWVINEAGSLLTRMVPRMVGTEGAFSLDTFPEPMPLLVLTSSPLWDGWAEDSDAAAAAARKNMEKTMAPVVRELDERKQALQQRAVSPFVNAPTPYGYQPTTTASTPYTPEHQQGVDHQYALFPKCQQHQRNQSLRTMNATTPYQAQTTTQASTSASTPDTPEHQQSMAYLQYAETLRNQQFQMIPMMNATTPYQAQTTTQASTPAATPDTSEDQELMDYREHAKVLVNQQHQRMQRLPELSPWTPHTDQTTTDDRRHDPPPGSMRPPEPPFFAQHRDPSYLGAAVSPVWEEEEEEPQPQSRQPPPSLPPLVPAGSSTDGIPDHILRPTYRRGADRAVFNLPYHAYIQNWEGH